jgi:hypothetical protein
MDFIQTFEIDQETCDLICSRVKIPPGQKNPCALYTDIEELHVLFERIGREYFSKIGEYNYFQDPRQLKIKFEFWINYLPPWSFMQWSSEEGDTLNYLLFLKDTESVVEFFNPFIRGATRYKGRKGLLIVLPAAWLFTRRYTNTLESDSIFVMGCGGVTNYEELKRA